MKIQLLRKSQINTLRWAVLGWGGGRLNFNFNISAGGIKRWFRHNIKGVKIQRDTVNL